MNRKHYSIPVAYASGCSYCQNLVAVNEREKEKDLTNVEYSTIGNWPIKGQVVKVDSRLQREHQSGKQTADLLGIFRKHNISGIYTEQFQKDRKGEKNNELHVGKWLVDDRGQRSIWTDSEAIEKGKKNNEIDRQMNTINVLLHMDEYT